MHHYISAQSLRPVKESAGLQVMKNFKINFYKAGLVPAANVYFSTGAESAAEHEGPLLRAEVLALKGPAPIDRGLLQQQRKDETRTSSQVYPHSKCCTFVHMALICRK